MPFYWPPAAALATNYSVTIDDGTTYTFTVESYSYDQKTDLIKANPWWGNESLAKDIATRSDATGGSSPAGTDALFAYSTFVSGDDLYVSTYGTKGTVDALKGRSPETTMQVNYAEFQSISYVPEIDGAALAKGTFALAALGLYTLGARREDRPVERV
ncbi:hypothetical protein V6X63_10290 [Spiribacter sp. 221]|uniref:hypothetical protein n=1 Tax=Spiribacter onubensis TaxID=3122420 RepID=UPI00349F5D87